jgi:phosphoglycerate dehydrogenase-like enzyme
LGIIGFGKAGKLVSERMKAFGMSIAFYDPYIKDWNGPEKNLELDELLTSSDIVSIHVIKTKETENLISKAKTRFTQRKCNINQHFKRRCSRRGLFN